MTDQTWPCEAYDEGPGVPANVRALAYEHCFFELSVRCTTAAECGANMYSERRMMWRRLNDNAAAGDEVAAMVLEGFTGPDELLGGPGHVEPGGAYCLDCGQHTVRDSAGALVIRHKDGCPNRR